MISIGVGSELPLKNYTQVYFDRMVSLIVTVHTFCCSNINGVRKVKKTPIDTPVAAPNSNKLNRIIFYSVLFTPSLPSPPFSSQSFPFLPIFLTRFHSFYNPTKNSNSQLPNCHFSLLFFTYYVEYRLRNLKLEPAIAC